MLEFNVLRMLGQVSAETAGSVFREFLLSAARWMICEAMSLEVTELCGDPTRRTQVVYNLLNNSAKYGRLGGKMLLHLLVRDGSVIVRVQDDGIGISAHRMQYFFNGQN